MFGKKKKRINATNITLENFDEKIGASKNAFIFFEAPWCGACKLLHPILNQLSDENQDKDVLIGVVNADEQRELQQDYEIMSLPTLIIFKNGQKIAKTNGMISKPRLQEMIDKEVQRLAI